MSEVTNEKLQRLIRISDDGNGNTIPEHLFPANYDFAAYNARSRNKKDIEEQKMLYIKLFECCKSYGQGTIDSLIYWKNKEAFKHPEELHKMLDFLTEAGDPISHDDGTWLTWMDPDPLAIEAKLAKNGNKPKSKEERSSEVKIDTDSSQFERLSTRQKLETDLSQVIRHDFVTLKVMIAL